MINISLLEMGKTKKRSLREAIIFILSKEFPMSIKRIYNKVKKEYSLSVTYQAVFKTVKEMLNERILEESEKEYKLNIEWIKELENEINIIKKNYFMDEAKESKESIQNRLNDFVVEIGPRIKEYFGKDKACIIGVFGGGRLFGMALLKYLLKEGLDVKYLEISRNKINIGKLPFTLFKKEDVENKKIILVDSAIYSGNTYRFLMEKINKIKKKFKIKDVKYVVDKDLLGLADFSRT